MCAMLYSALSKAFAGIGGNSVLKKNWFLSFAALSLLFSSSLVLAKSSEYSQSQYVQSAQGAAVDEEYDQSVKAVLEELRAFVGNNCSGGGSLFGGLAPIVLCYSEDGSYEELAALNPELADSLQWVWQQVQERSSGSFQAAREEFEEVLLAGEITVEFSFCGFTVRCTIIY